MVTEGVYGQLKGRWRVILRESDSEPSQVKTTTVACMVLHNIWIEKGDAIFSKLDLTRDPRSNEKRDCQAIRNALEMTARSKVPASNAQAIQIQNTLADIFWRERESFEASWNNNTKCEWK